MGTGDSVRSSATRTNVAHSTCSAAAAVAKITAVCVLPLCDYGGGSTSTSMMCGSGGNSPVDDFALTFRCLELGRVEPCSKITQSELETPKGKPIK